MGIRDLREYFTDSAPPLVHQTLRQHYRRQRAGQEENSLPTVLKALRSGYLAVIAWDEDWQTEGYCPVPALDGGHTDPDELRQDFERWAAQSEADLSNNL